MPGVEESGEVAHRSGRAIAIAIAAAALLAAAYVVVGMPGMDHGEPVRDDRPMATMEHGAAPLARLDPEAFAARVADPAAFVVNVHTPYEGEIEGTDAFIPADEIAGHSMLPSEWDADILVYCRSGRMSQAAADALLDAGYTNVADLAGGMDAWAEAGRPLRRQPSTD